MSFSPAPYDNQSHGSHLPAPVPPHSGQPGGPAGPPQKPPINLAFLLTVWRQWRLIVVPIGLVLAGTACTAVLLLFRPSYESKATMRISKQYVAFRDGMNRGKSFFQNQVQLIKSPMVLQEVVTKSEIANIPQIRQSKDPVSLLQKSLIIKPVGGSDFFTIRYRAFNPKHAKLIAEAVSLAYERLQADYANANSQKIVALLQEEKTFRRKELDRLQNELRNATRIRTGIDPLNPYGAEKQLVTNVEGQTVIRLRTSDPAAPLLALQKQIVDKEMQIAVGRARLTALSTRKQAPAPTAEAIEARLNENGRVQRLAEEIRGAKAALLAEEAKRAPGTDPPNLRQLREHIAEKEKLLTETKAEVLPNIKTRMENESKQSIEQASLKMRSTIERARIELSVLEKKFQEQVQGMDIGTEKALSMEFLRSDVSRARSIVNLLSDRIVKIKTEDRKPSDVRLFSPAEVPTSPVEAVPFKQMLMFGALSLAFPAGLAFLWELRVRRVADVSLLEQSARIPVIGQIACLPVRKRSSEQSSGDLLLFEESIDSLRTSLTLSDSLHDLQVLAVTSAASQEGKTSVASQLAVSLSRSTGELTLLIDGDMRSPDVHNVFDVENEPGLAAVLGGEATLDEAIIDDWNDSIHILPAGQLHTNPHKLVGGTLRDVLQEARKRYRYIVIDTPPVLAASESLVLCKQADTSLVCAMRNVSRLEQVQLVCQRLSAAGTPPTGIVLNGVPTKRYAYDYGYGYGYGYRYGYVRNS